LLKKFGLRRTKIYELKRYNYLGLITDRELKDEIEFRDQRALTRHEALACSSANVVTPPSLETDSVTTSPAARRF